MASLAIRNIEVSGSGFLKGLAPDMFVERLAEKLGDFAGRAVAGADDTAFSHYVCSSTLDISCSGGWLDPVVLTRKIRARSGLACAYSNAMQCATWGFLVRQHLVNKPYVRNVLVSIVDANPLEMRFWENNASWGKTSYRVTSVHLEIPYPDNAEGQGERPADAITVGKCNPSVMLYDYALEIQKALTRHADHTIAVPYFEEKMRKGLKRSMNGHACLPDLYEDYGHLYGSDPWISIAMDRERADFDGSGVYLASSIASEGYFCFLSTNVDALTRTSIEST